MMNLHYSKLAPFSTLKILTSVASFCLAVGCIHPIDIEGSGDVLSSTGDRDCYALDAPCEFNIASDYNEVYTAVPALGHEFIEWRGCIVLDQLIAEQGNQCAFTIPKEAVEKNWFTRQPTLKAVFREVETDTPEPVLSPIESVTPVYPDAALANRIGGTCTIEFLVTVTGDTVNHEIVNCSNLIFVDASLEAAEELRYEPRIENGAGVEISGVSFTFEYQINGSAIDERIDRLYKSSCISCHLSGAAGAPLTGSIEAWTPVLAKGMEVLVGNTINGVRAMPPGGLCFDCSENDFRQLIEYMSDPER